MGEVDGAFVPQPHNGHNPSLFHQDDDQGIPIIDLSCPDVDALVRDIRRACEQWGVFQVINHGVPTDDRLKTDEVQREFFRLSSEDKRKVKRDAQQVLGYFDAERTKDRVDWKEVFDFTAQEPTLAAASVDPDDDRVAHWNNQWPEKLPGMRDVCLQYAKNMSELGMRLLGLIAMSLGLSVKRFEGFFKDPTHSLRLLYYPPSRSAGATIGVGCHTDISIFTILAQDEVGGLEAKRKSDGAWVEVKPIPNAYIINLGDILQVWTNGAYESCEHRVMVNSEKERYSIVFFLYPSHYTMVGPLEEMTEEKNPARYRAHNWGKFLLTRKGGNIKKPNGEETLEIKHYRIY